MAFNAGTVVAGLEANTSEFNLGMRAAKKELHEFTVAAKKAGGQSNSFFKDLVKFEVAKAVVVGAFHAMKAAIESALGVLERANTDFDDFELSVQKLDVALQLRGIADMKGELMGLAETLQDTTKFSRNAVLGVEALAANAGVAGKDIAEFTAAATSLAQVAGIDLNNAGKQLARTLSGGIGRSITQVLPEVNNMTKAMRASGGIIDLINEKLGGTAQALSDTSAVLENRFSNAVTEAFANLGETFNPIVDVFLQQGIKLAGAVGDGIKQNSQKITDVFAAVVTTALDMVPGAIDLAFDFTPLVASAAAVGIKIGLSFLTAFQRVKIVILEVAAAMVPLGAIADNLASLLTTGSLSSTDWAGTMREANLELTQATAKLTQLEASASAAAAGADALAAGVSAAAVAAQQGVGPLGEAATFLKDSAKSAGDAVAAMTTAGLQAVVMVNSYKLVEYSAGKWRQESVQVAKTQAQIAAAAQATIAPAKQVTEHAKRLKEEMEAIKKAIHDEAYNFNVAAEAARGVTEEVQRTRQAVDDVNAAQQAGSGGGSSAGGAFGTGGAGDAFGRHSGGRASFATDNAAATQATITGLQGLANQATIGTSARSHSQYVVMQGLIAKLKGQLAEESKAFASEIISQLNQQGILDPTQRSSFIQARFDEARRLGVLPRGATYASGGGG